MKKIYIMPIMLVLLLSMVGIVYGATATWIAPTNGGRVTRVYNINISTTLLNTSTNIPINCTITGSSSQTGESISEYAYNSSANASDLNWTIQANFSDASDWSLSGSCTNGTDTATLSSITVTFDNSIPVCHNQSVITNNQKIDFTNKSYTLTYISTNTTAGTIIADGSNYTLTESTSGDNTTLTKNIATLIPTKMYTLFAVQVTDGLNISHCIYASNVNFDKRSGTKPVLTSTVLDLKRFTGLDGKTIIIVGIVLVILFGIWHETNKK